MTTLPNALHPAPEAAYLREQAEALQEASWERESLRYAGKMMTRYPTVPMWAGDKRATAADLAGEDVPWQCFSCAVEVQESPIERLQRCIAEARQSFSEPHSTTLNTVSVP